MRRLAFCSLCLALAAPPAQAFLRGRVGGGGPFFRRADFTNITFLIHDQTAPGLANSTGGVIITADSDPVGAIQAAMNVWTNVATSNAAFAPPGRTSALLNSRDGQHVFYFADTPETRSAVGDAVAVTLQSFNPGTGAFVDTDIIFNPGLSFSSTLQAGTYDIQAVATHELGHALGSGHSGLLAATMFFSIRRGAGDQGRLTADDVAFLTEVYPDPVVLPATGVLGGTVTLSGGGGGVPGALVTAVDSSTSVAVGTLTGSNGAYSISSLPAGRYFVYTEPMDGPVNPDQLGGAGVGANTAFLTAVAGGAATPVAVTVGVGGTATANFTVESGAPALNLQQGGVGPPGAGSITLSSGAFALTAGQSWEIALSGRGLDDTSITDTSISFLGAPIAVTAGSLRRGMTGMGVPALRFVVQVGAAAPPGVATILIRSAASAAVFSAGARILPPSPSFAAAGVVNGASFVGGLAAPGEIISIFGTGLGPADGVSGDFDPSGRLTTQLADVTVTFNGVRAPLFFVRRDQINAQVPFEAAPGPTASVVVNFAGASSVPITVPLAAARPGIFVFPGGRAIVLNQDNTLNDAGNAAPRGSVITIFATGQGGLDPALATGQPAPVSPLSSAARSVAAIIGARSGRVLFAGMTPGFVGLLQVNVEIDPQTPIGPAVPLSLNIGGVLSQPNVTVAIRDAS